LSLHADARRALSAWSAPNPDQGVLRLEYLDYLARHEDAMWRTCLPGHLTASALVMEPRAGLVLLTLHPKVGRWLQLGGHCEPADRTLAGAAWREATEESGIDALSLVGGPLRLDRHRVGCGHDGSQAEHLDVQFLALAGDAGPVVAGTESIDLCWFGVDALPEGTDDSVRALVARALAVLG